MNNRIYSAFTKIDLADFAEYLGLNETDTNRLVVAIKKVMEAERESHRQKTALYRETHHDEELARRREIYAQNREAERKRMCERWKTVKDKYNANRREAKRRAQSEQGENT